MKKKLVIVCIALLLTLSAIGTGTFAWFSMNNKVDTYGMELYTSAPTNMLISTDPTDPSGWKNGVTSVHITPNKFMPSSTTNGKDFFAIAATDGIDVLGGIINNENIAVVQLAKVNRYDESNYYYAEFPLYIKASLQPDVVSTYNIKLESMTVSDTTHNLQKTVRASICYVDPYGSTSTNADTGVVTINQDGTVQDSSSRILTQSTPVIYKYDTATAVKPVESLSDVTTGTAVLAAEDTAIAAGSAQTCFQVDHTATYYTTVIVRIWFEGQNSYCINEAADEVVSVTMNWKVKED